jgi:hypothetical protein
MTSLGAVSFFLGVAAGGRARSYPKRRLQGSKAPECRTAPGCAGTDWRPLITNVNQPAANHRRGRAGRRLAASPPLGRALSLGYGEARARPLSHAVLQCRARRITPGVRSKRLESPRVDGPPPVNRPSACGLSRPCVIPGSRILVLPAHCVCVIWCDHHSCSTVRIPHIATRGLGASPPMRGR